MREFSYLNQFTLQKQTKITKVNVPPLIQDVHQLRLLSPFLILHHKTTTLHLARTYI